MKIITALQAAVLLKDNTTIGISGFGSCGSPDELLQGVEENFKICGHPAGVTVLSGICTGNNKFDNIGHNRLCIEGLIDTIIAAHFKNAAALDKMVTENTIAGFTLPLGIEMNLLRAAAAKRPGIISRVGLHTYVDPRKDGCAVNKKAKAQGRFINSLMEIDGKEYLFYKTIPLDACLIRATYADEDGNISLQHEVIREVQLEMAMATHNNGGIVFVQVEKLVKNGSIPPREVFIHHKIVDYVIIGKPENHKQSYVLNSYHPELSGELRIPQNVLPPMPLNLRKVVARRAVMELKKGMIINLGIGMPSGVGSVANEEGLTNYTTMSLESGLLGGVPTEGVGFGGAANFEAMMFSSDTFNFYDGGGLDMAVLGMAEVDENGDVNVSKFGRSSAGPGGFIDITQNTPIVCFIGGFTATKPNLELGNGNLVIKKDGTGVKFVKRVQQVTFSADYARETGQNILYITERAVFRLTKEGVQMIEVAPGIDIERDIINRMEFKPFVKEPLRVMDIRIFCNEKMNLTFFNSSSNGGS